MYGQTHQHDEAGRIQLHVNVTTALHKRITDLARANGDSIASTIRGLLRAGVEQRGTMGAGRRG